MYGICLGLQFVWRLKENIRFRGWNCPWVVPGWDRRALSAELDEDTPLSDCADHLVVVNNVLNSAIPLVSEDCQDILRLDVLSPAGSQFHRYFIVLRNIAAHVMSYLC